MGEDGEQMLKHLLWSNGRETEETSVENKQCAGKDIVGTMGRLLLAYFFVRYDSLEKSSSSSVTLTMLTTGSFF